MKRNKLALALTATLGLGAIATNAQAVNIAENGVGDFAYNPYFSVAKAQDQFISIVNTSNKTVAAKIVFRRGTDSIEVRDFIIILSPKDVWSGRISPVIVAGAVTNAKVFTADKSCTVPEKDKWAPEAGGFSVAFDSNIFGNNVVSSSFVSTNVVSGFQSQQIKDIKEGYFTVAVMGVSNIPTDTPNTVAYFAKHVGGTPRNCAAISNNWPTAQTSIQSQFPTAENVLRVSSIMIDAKSNLAMGVPVTTLANAFGGKGQIRLSGNDNPKEPEMDRSVNVFHSDSAKLYSGTADKAERAVSAVLMNDSIYGTYDFTGGTQSSWVVTFPTKRALMTLKPAVQPFKDSIVPLSVSSWDNEEAEEVTKTDVPFSPFFPEITPGKTLPYEVNVINFTVAGAVQNPLASLLGTPVNQLYSNGWMQVGFPDAQPVTVGTSTFGGMPVIGFEYFENGGFSAANNLGFSKVIK